MKTSGVRELKNRLSAYLRMVENGERVAITCGRIVAELGPPTHTTFPTQSCNGSRAGTVRLGAPNQPEVYPPSPSRVPSGTVQELLDDVRGER